MRRAAHQQTPDMLLAPAVLARFCRRYMCSGRDCQTVGTRSSTRREESNTAWVFFQIFEKNWDHGHVHFLLPRLQSLPPDGLVNEKETMHHPREFAVSRWSWCRAHYSPLRAGCSLDVIHAALAFTVVCCWLASFVTSGPLGSCACVLACLLASQPAGTRHAVSSSMYRRP